MSFWQNKVIEVSARQNITFANLCERRKVAPQQHNKIVFDFIDYIFLYLLFIFAGAYVIGELNIYMSIHKCSNIYNVFDAMIYLCVF